MKNKDGTKPSPITHDLKTAPPGMAPDLAHYEGETSPGRRTIPPEGNFNNARGNAESKQTPEKLK